MQRTLLLALLVLVAAGRSSAGPVGYYRHPAIHGERVVFVAEGDLWTVPAAGGLASRLTSHPGMETNPVLSPDGSTVAFTAEYEGPNEVYTMPADGGLPRRWTFDGSRCSTEGFTPDGRLVYVTRREAGLPDLQPVLVNLEGGRRERVPLSQAAEAAWSDDGRAVFFVRFPFQGSHTKRYQGGTAQDIWRFDPGSGAEARCLTGDHPGTDSDPMFWRGRVYFVSDRDGFMNIWSMTPEGGDLRQHTRHTEWDVKDPALSGGRIVYQLGADLRLFDIPSGEDAMIPIHLDTDLDQAREKWIRDPWEWLTSAHLSPSGDRVVLTARGQVFVAPHGPGRLVEATRGAGVRYWDARFAHDSASVLALSDESGEVEFWHLPANGVGARTQITRGANVLRWEGSPSPDGKRLAHHDKNRILWMTDIEGGRTTKVDECPDADFSDLAWSPDGRCSRTSASRRTSRGGSASTASRTAGSWTRRPTATRATRRPGRRTASGSASSRTGTSSRSCAIRGDRGSRTRTTTGRRRSTRSPSCPGSTLRSSRTTSSWRPRRRTRTARRTARRPKPGRSLRRWPWSPRDWRRGSTRSRSPPETTPASSWPASGSTGSPCRTGIWGRSTSRAPRSALAISRS